MLKRKSPSGRSTLFEASVYFGGGMSVAFLTLYAIYRYTMKPWIRGVA